VGASTTTGPTTPHPSLAKEGNHFHGFRAPVSRQAWATALKCAVIPTLSAAKGRNLALVDLGRSARRRARFLASAYSRRIQPLAPRLSTAGKQG
jgi:hypothetical protein